MERNQSPNENLLRGNKVRCALIAPGKNMRPPITDDQFSTLIEEHKGIIYKIANSYCRNAEDRKDLIQEIVVHLWKSHDRYDERFKLSTWIYRIALNVAISAYRREKKRSERVSPLEEIIIEPAAESVEESDPKIATLYRIIDQLDELNRALMILYLDDNSYRDIAGILGLTETNVATKINRLKLKIKEQFTQTNTD
jgi:RNA polymerase sigma factor (sigma-70 family)